MRLKYVGAHDGVELALPSGAVITAMRDGEPVTVPDDLGARLLEQVANWKPADKPARDAAKAADADESAKEGD